MKLKLLTLLTQMLTAAAAVLVILADRYMYEGFGLNPWVAIPAATVCMFIPYIVDHFFIGNRSWSET